MASKLEQAARMHAIAAEFRGFAAQTNLPLYRARMLEMADDLDFEAAKLDGYRLAGVTAPAPARKLSVR